MIRKNNETYVNGHYQVKENAGTLKLYEFNLSPWISLLPCGGCFLMIVAEPIKTSLEI